MSARTIASTLTFLVGGCTFAGVGRYDIPSCVTPTGPSTLDDDPCSALGSGPTACSVYQCNVHTGRCEQGPRDFDRDGDPAPSCGGHDCDDRDPQRRTGKVEVCDGVDDDCNGIADDDLLRALGATTLASGMAGDASLSSTSGADVLAAAVSEPPEGRGSGPVPVGCIVAVRADGAAIDPPCTFLSRADALSPRQPWASPIVASDVSFGAVFSDVSDPACAGGRVGFRNTKRGGFVASCAEAGAGASVPSFAPFPGGETAVMAWLDAPVVTRADPVLGCASAAPASLEVAWIERPTASDPPPRTYAFRRALARSRAVRPVSLVPRGSAVLLAAPADESVGLWLLEAPLPDGSGRAVTPLLSPSALDALAGARSVAMALATDLDGETLAIAAEIGCAPAQRVALVLVRLDAPGPTATVVRAVEVTGTSALATGPGIAWLASRREWWVAWSAGRPDARVLSARAVSADGAVLGEVVSSQRDAIAVAPRVTGSDPRALDVSFVDRSGALGSASFGCSP